MTFEECLIEKAKEGPYVDALTFSQFEEVKIAARKYAIEAIKADRQRINQLCLQKTNIHEGVSFSCPFDVDMINNLPILL